MSKITDTEFLNKLLDFCVDSELLTESKTDYVREAWSKSHNQGGDRFTKELAMKYGPSFASSLDSLVDKYFEQNKPAPSPKVAVPVPSSSQNIVAAPPAPPVPIPVATTLSPEDIIRKREEAIKNMSTYKTAETLLRDCVIRKRVSLEEAHAFLEQMFMKNDGELKGRKSVHRDLPPPRFSEILKLTQETAYKMKQASIDQSMIRKIFNRINDESDKLILSDEASSALSDGIQVHLRTIVDSVLKLAHARVKSTTTQTAFKELFESMPSGEVTENTMNKVALKWGPPIGDILADEEVNSKEFYKEFRKDDEKKLEEKMKQVEENLAVLAGTKRKTVNDGADLTWWKKDDVIEKEGKMSWQQLAELQMKLELAKRVGYGPAMTAAKRKELQKRLQAEEEERQKKLAENENEMMLSSGSFMQQGGNASILVVEEEAAESKMEVVEVNKNPSATPYDKFTQQINLPQSKITGKITKDDVIKVLGERSKIRLRK